MLKIFPHSTRTTTIFHLAHFVLGVVEFFAQLVQLFDGRHSIVR
jgi:hypothetical protein